MSNENVTVVEAPKVAMRDRFGVRLTTQAGRINKVLIDATEPLGVKAICAAAQLPETQVSRTRTHLQWLKNRNHAANTDQGWQLTDEAKAKSDPVPKVASPKEATAPKTNGNSRKGRKKKDATPKTDFETAVDTAVQPAEPVTAAVSESQVA